MTDLLLIIDQDPDSLVVLRTVADYLGRDRIECAWNCVTCIAGVRSCASPQVMA
jgi:hypothetical protein